MDYIKVFIIVVCKVVAVRDVSDLLLKILSIRNVKRMIFIYLKVYIFCSDLISNAIQIQQSINSFD